MTGRLQGKAAIVTGAASGIGRASAILFAQEGAKVLALDLSDAVSDTVATITEAGGVAIARVADTADEDTVMSAVANCRSEFGTVDVAYANAGVESAPHGF